MPHNITEVDAFTTPVTVPDGPDDHLLLSSYILAFVQALTNRTLNVKNLVTAILTHAVYTDVANTFTVAPQKVNDNNANRPILTTDKTCNDDPTSPNLWKRIFEFPTPDAGKWRLFTGTVTNDQQIALTLNASWAAGAQHWVSDDTGQPSIALLYMFSGVNALRISARPAGSGSWTDWEFSGTDAGSLIANGQVVAGDAVSAPVVLAPTSTDADQGKGFNYNDAGWRTHKLNLADFEGNSDLYENLFSDGIEGVYWTTLSGRGDMTAWPINLGAGCHIGEIRVRHVQSTTIVGGNDQFILQKKTGLTGARSTIDTTTASSGGGTAQTTTVHTGGDETVVENTEYWLRWKMRNTDGTFTTHRIQAIEVDVWDPGPRTKVN